MSAPLQKFICFDLDDTLIDDNWKFQTTFCDCMKAIFLGLNVESPQIDEVLELARKKDNDYFNSLPKSKQYSPERLVMVWQETYKDLAKKKNITPKDHILQLLRGYALHNYEPPYLVIPGVIECLITIQNMKNKPTLAILTVGDIHVQTKKIAESGLEQYFDYIQVVDHPDGKEEYLHKKAKEYGVENVFMIGNSVSSDINPALKAGVHAIYIPRGSWHRNHAQCIHNDYASIGGIKELGEKIKEACGE